MSCGVQINLGHGVGGGNQDDLCGSIKYHLVNATTAPSGSYLMDLASYICRERMYWDMYGCMQHIHEPTAKFTGWLGPETVLHTAGRAKKGAHHPLTHKQQAALNPFVSTVIMRNITTS